jgi:hypothetical protein
MHPRTPISLDRLHHFEKHSRKLTKDTRRLFFLDGYRSHHTIEYIQYCDNNGVIPFGFPTHTTHILQPLDVAVSDGCTRFNKVEFLSAIGEIRRPTFKESTVKSACRKTGIVPFKPSTVLSQFQSPAESEPTTPSRSSTGRHNLDVLKTAPLTIRSLKCHPSSSIKMHRKTIGDHNIGNPPPSSLRCAHIFGV